MSKAGDRPGAGRYTCVSCGQVVFVESDGDSLGPCPHCGGTHYAP